MTDPAKCSECGHPLPTDQGTTKYCPHCEQKARDDRNAREHAMWTGETPEPPPAKQP